MSEAFLGKKIQTLFKRFDADNSGSIESSDFDKWSEKLIALGNLNADQSKALKDNINSIWQTYFQPADVDGDGKITCQELLEHIKKVSLRIHSRWFHYLFGYIGMVSRLLQVIGDASKRQVIENALPTIFDSIDANKDGGISKSEFGNYFKSLNITDQAVIDQVFDSMDINKDGDLSKQEFSDFGKGFFFGADESSPSKSFFGPLI